MMGHMDDLVQFLRDRYDEDEQAARATEWCAGTMTFNGWDKHRADEDDYEVQSRGATIARGMGLEFAAHIVRHDPARVLRDVEAKRQLVDWVLRWPLRPAPPSSVDGVLEMLALPYADHPDYKETWKS